MNLTRTGVDRKETDQRLLIWHIWMNKSTEPQSELSQNSKNSSAQTQKKIGANHSQSAAVLWRSHMPVSQHSLKSSVQHFCHGSKMPQLQYRSTTTLSDHTAAEHGCPRLSLLHYCLPASLSRCYQDILLHKFWQLQKAPGHLNVSQTQQVWNSRRAPRQQAKGDHSTDAWPQFRKVQQHILITAKEKGHPGAWSLVLGLLSTECITKWNA